ncbi:hypothetical protein L596_008672 [Steinernema carpocapsae]|uniref:Uncharacterized protein n=1 Tax=Steinernema carpocapsae TaxID=34508 RepID=A0A4U5PDQ2_STECR|nr:hypothetical protein L596_008672 [Steinernema carpocapsae]
MLYCCTTDKCNLNGAGTTVLGLSVAVNKKFGLVSFELNHLRLASKQLRLSICVCAMYLPAVFLLLPQTFFCATVFITHSVFLFN